MIHCDSIDKYIALNIGGFNVTIVYILAHDSSETEFANASAATKIDRKTCHYLKVDTYLDGSIIMVNKSYACRH